MSQKRHISNMLIVELIMRCSQCRLYTKNSFVSVFPIQKVIVCKKFLYFVRIYQSDYMACGIHIERASKAPSQQCSLNYSTSAKALYHDVNQTE
jgi:hypothetical protein